MLGKVFIVLLWMVFLAEIPCTIIYGKKYLNSHKARNHEPEASTIVCVLFTSAIVATTFFLCVFFPENIKEALQNDSFLKYFTSPINLFALFAFMVMGIFDYYMNQQLKYAHAIQVGDLSEFDDPDEEYWKSEGIDWSSKPKVSHHKTANPRSKQKPAKMSPSYTTTATTSSVQKDSSPHYISVPSKAPRGNFTHVINANHKNTDNGKATLYILEPYEQHEYSTLGEARAFMDSQEYGDFIILTDHTIIFRLTTYRTRNMIDRGKLILEEFLNYNKGTIIEQDDYGHYLEITKGLWEDEEFDQYLVDVVYVCAIDGGY